MKKTIFSVCFLLCGYVMMAQKLTTTSAVINFDATTAIDKLSKAENKTVIGSLDKTTGAVMFEAAVNNFSFTNPTMQTHFNSDRWMNSAAFPKMSFSGKIDKLATVKFAVNGTYNSKVTGNLTIKGVTKKISVPVKFVVKNGKIAGTTSFTVALADYNINGPQVESGKVARVAKVNVAASF
jgi:polyisoprenoid-binding protein YceI